MSPVTRPILLRLDLLLLKALDAHCAESGRTRTGQIRLWVGAGVQSVPSGRASEERPGSPGRATHQVHIRLTADEFRLARERTTGWRSIAGWAAGLVRRELGQGGPLLSDAERQEIGLSTRELRRLGVNLNQVAHQLNADDRHRVTALERTDIQRAIRAIDLHTAFVENLFAGDRHGKN